VWVLTIALLALLVWLVGQRVDERPHAEIGLTAGEELPMPATPTPTPAAAESVAGGGDRPPPERTSGEDGSGGEPTAAPAVPVSPAPRR
jgi:hypothetical protein